MNSVSNPGVYVHIPFCIKKCRYCDFYSIADRKKIDPFVHCAQREIQSVETPIRCIDTIYFGGGTPSVLDGESIDRLMNAIGRKFSFADDVEATIEINPGTISSDKLAAYQNAGFNRINIGIQSFHDDLLKILGRIHNAHEARQSFEMARRAGFGNVGLDLIFGIPGQSGQMWEKDLEAAVKLSPEHISCYMLSFEPGTEMAMDLEKGKIKAMPEKGSAMMFELAHRFLEQAGYLHYEISNYASKLSTRSKHNLKYWSFAPYIGIGPSAHSFICNRRYWNMRSVNEYIDRIKLNQSPCESSETLDSKQQMTEAILLGFRCAEGISVKDFEQRFAIDFRAQFGNLISAFESEDFINYSDGFCRLTLKGMLMLDSIVKHFVYQI